MSEYYYRHHVEREILSALTDGELGPEERRYVHEHLRECEACREAAEAFGAVKGMVGELPRLIAPESFVSRALEPATGSLTHRAASTAFVGRRRWIWCGIAAAATGITLAGLFVPQRASTPPVDVLFARHVSVHDGVDAGGQVLFAVRGR